GDDAAVVADAAGELIPRPHGCRQDLGRPDRRRVRRTGRRNAPAPLYVRRLPEPWNTGCPACPAGNTATSTPPATSRSAMSSDPRTASRRPVGSMDTSLELLISSGREASVRDSRAVTTPPRPSLAWSIRRPVAVKGSGNRSRVEGDERTEGHRGAK